MDLRTREGGDVFRARMAVMIGEAVEFRRGEPAEGRSMAARKTCQDSAGWFFVAGAAGGNCFPGLATGLGEQSDYQDQNVI